MGVQAKTVVREGSSITKWSDCKPYIRKLGRSFEADKNFEGFFPVKKGRKTRFELLESLPATIVIYESPLRVLRTLRDIGNYWGNRVVSICRELTKIYEENFVGLVTEAIQLFEKSKPKGEFVILVAKNGYEYKK